MKQEFVLWETLQKGAKTGEAVKKGYVGIHSTGFRDFLLKPELLRAIVDCGFEHPSEGKRFKPLTRPTHPPLFAGAAVSGVNCLLSRGFAALHAILDSRGGNAATFGGETAP